MFVPRIYIPSAHRRNQSNLQFQNFNRNMNVIQTLLSFMNFRYNNCVQFVIDCGKVHFGQIFESNSQTNKMVLRDLLTL